MRRILWGFLFTCLTTIALGQAAQLQPAPASDVVIGSGSFSPIVGDLEKSLVFYNDLLVLLCYKRFGPQKGQHGSCRIRARASLMRSVAMD